MSSFKIYLKYKPSNIDWLGNIPESWNISAAKYCFSIVTGATPRSDVSKYWDGNICWVTPADLSQLDSQYISSSAKNITVEGLNSCGTSIVPPGSIILSTRAPIGSLAINTKEICHNQGCKSLIPSKKTCSLFYAYFLSAFTEILNALGKGTTFLEISRNELSMLSIPVPQLSEQQEIASFLDRETKKIDDLIAEQQKLIDLITEKRQALISHAVIKGLNPDVSMKSSGIDWLGDIPAHWTVQRCKVIFTEIDDRATADDDETLLTVSHITGVTPRSEKNVNMFLAESLDGYKKCTANDLVINTMWAWMGAMGISPCNGVVSPSYNVYRFRNEQNPKYFDMLSRLPNFVTVVKAYSTGIWESRLRLYPNVFFDLKICIPPISEQREITAFLQKKLKKFALLIAEAERGIELLQERRSALISAVVTGKICIVELAEEQKREQSHEANAFFKRSVFAAEIIKRMHHEPTFGHVKFQKILFLAENICNIDLATHYHRDAAGPYDNRALRSVDSQLLKQKWFRCEKQDKGYRYVPLENEGKYREYFERYFSDNEERLSALCKRFMTATTEQCEIVATLYSAWKDLLATEHPSDDQIVDEVLTNWHSSKQRIPRDRWMKALGWMRKENLCPL